MKLPIAYDNFKDIIDKRFDNATQIAVITRPLRFGKTLNLSMLHYFLASEAYGQSVKGLFEGLKIAELGDEYMRHQGRYPVIEDECRSFRKSVNRNGTTSAGADSATKLFIGSASARPNEYYQNRFSVLWKAFPDSSRTGEHSII
ncbi:MAG: AAA family ATPase [Proteobacteria bacterium]|nr:AAA family ATPase [Pseudomonadota bacterium]